MAVRVDTHQYEAAHGHKPRQPHGQSTSPWAFEIDWQPTPFTLTASYRTALQHATSRAKWVVRVLP